ncbi:MAG: hypothetical protein WBZ51_26440 [Xanthobacteraceae bacterium]
MFAIDRSILNRSSRIYIGQLCLSYSIGGHEAAGTCQTDNERAETNKSGLIERLAA